MNRYQVIYQRHAVERMAQRGVSEEEAMKCVICKQGETQPGTTTMTLERDTTTVVFKNVPAEVCQICGEAYLDAATTRHLLHIVEEAARLGVQ
jgi:YgiT-type zinc finger domain-containing protein